MYQSWLIKYKEIRIALTTLSAPKEISATRSALLRLVNNQQLFVVTENVHAVKTIKFDVPGCFLRISSSFHKKSDWLHLS